MAYGLKYTCDFDSFTSIRYTLQFLKKDYAGAVETVRGAAVPVVQKWSTDEPRAAIKGSSLEIKLENFEGSFPLSNFYSNEDDTWQVKFFRETDLKFFGYLVQDDCQEPEISHSHEITLSATDNLGLLKDVPLNQITTSFTFSVEITYSSPNTFDIVSGVANIITGDSIVITGGSNLGMYSVLNALVPTINSVQVAPDIVFWAGTEAVSIEVIRAPYLQGRYNLAQIIKYCLIPTRLELSCNVYAQIKPVGLTRWLETQIDISTFLSGDTWQSCYQVLETILSRFNATIVQADGVWNIVRWDELRDFANLIDGYEYDSDMIYVADITLNNSQTVAGLRDVQTALSKSIIRGYRFVKEKFDFHQPANLLRNANFARVGALITSYTSGTDTIYEYEMSDWDVGHEWNTAGTAYVASSAERFIRVTIDQFGEESERIGVIRGASGFDDWACAESFPIELRIGDKVKYSFDYRTNVSQSNKNTYFRLNLVTTASFTPRSINNRYINTLGLWTRFGFPPPSGLLLLSYVPTSENTNTWHSVEVQSVEADRDGILLIKLSQSITGAGSGDETMYKNLRFEVVFSVAGNRNVIGQTHTDTQSSIINNSLSEDINIDDSPRNSIAGTLFLDTFTGPLQDRTRLWQRGTVSETYRLGEITTFDELILRSIPRTKLEGSVLYSNLSILTLIKYTPLSTLNFIFGMLSIDYKNNLSDGTLWEMYEDSESDQFNNTYVFKYLYE